LQIHAHCAFAVIHKTDCSTVVSESFYRFEGTLSFLGVMMLTVKLLVDGEQIDLNEFVEKILSGTIVGAVTSLRGVKKDWKKIEIELSK